MQWLIQTCIRAQILRSTWVQHEMKRYSFDFWGFWKLVSESKQENLFEHLRSIAKFSEVVLLSGNKLITLDGDLRTIYIFQNLLEHVGEDLLTGFIACWVLTFEKIRVSMRLPTIQYKFKRTTISLTTFFHHTRLQLNNDRGTYKIIQIHARSKQGVQYYFK